jgi:hypothetical protein
LSSMMRRIEARISSMEGSRCALLACAIVTSAAPGACPRKSNDFGKASCAIQSATASFASLKGRAAP